MRHIPGQKTFGRTRRVVYLTLGLGGITALGWALAFQVLWPPPPESLRLTGVVPGQEVHHGQAPAVDQPRAKELSPSPRKGVLGDMTTPAPGSRQTQRGAKPRGMLAGTPDTSTRRPDDLAVVRDLTVDLLLIPRDLTSEINQTRAALARHGTDAVAVIQQFLNTEDDSRLAALSGLPAVEVRSARLRLIEALHAIGSPEALNVMVQALRSTIRPAEIALLATSVEAQAPGAFREDILIAAQASLRVAAANLKETVKMMGDLQPLLPVFVAYGDAPSVTDLEEAWPRWTTLSTVALAELPDGKGIDSLIRFVNDPQVEAARKNFPVQILAQASRVYPAASEALVALAEAKQLTGPAWEALAMALGGTETVLRTALPVQPAQRTPPEPAASGTAAETAAGPGAVVQMLQAPNVPVPRSGAGPASLAYLDYNSKAPQQWSDAAIDQRLDLIEQLLATEPASDANAALQKAQQSLLAWRQSKFVNGERKKL